MQDNIYTNVVNDDKNAIEIIGLNKSFKDVKAVQDLSFKVKQGEFFAFLGVNGAGKSTTISIICNTLRKDSGKVLVSGIDVDSESDDIKRSLGVVFQKSVLDGALSVRENLRHRASLYGIFDEEFEKRLDELSSMLDFKEFIKRPVSKLSGGQKRKIDIARALIHSPKILILDEPTTGLDPQTRTIMWKVINDLRKSDKLTVFLTTHYMEEAANADFVVVIDGGKKIAEGTPHDLKNQYTSDSVTVYGIDEEQAKTISADYKKVSGGYKFTVENTQSVAKMIMANPALFVDYEVEKGKMDDVFLNITGKSLTEAE